MIRGIDRVRRCRHGARQKSIGHETTFSRDMIDDADLRQTLLVLTDHAVSDMRGGRCGARTIAVRVKDADFVLRRASRTVPTALTTYQAIAPIAGELLQRLRAERRVPVRLVGVTLSQLSGDDGADQLPLFDTARAERETLKQRRLAEAVEHVRERLGQDAISYGTGANAPERGERRKGDAPSAPWVVTRLVGATHASPLASTTVRTPPAMRPTAPAIASRTVDRDPAGRGDACVALRIAAGTLPVTRPTAGIAARTTNAP